MHACRELPRLGWLDARGAIHDLPDWARWLIDLGVAAVRTPSDGLKRWIVVTLPDRRFASALVAHGAVVAAVRSKRVPSVEERFENAVPGSFLTWVDGDGASRFGKFACLRGGRIYYHPRVHGGWGPTTHRPLAAASSFWPATAEDEFTGGRPLACDPCFVRAATGLPNEVFLAASSVEVTLVATGTDLEDDLCRRDFVIDGHRGSLRDTVRPRRQCPKGQHYRSTIVPATADPILVSQARHGGPAVFDGPGGYLRLRDAVCREVNIVLIDRWHPRAEDAAITARMERAETGVDATVADLAAPPPGIEVLRWAAEP
jgi:hypothetical protein